MLRLQTTLGPKGRNAILDQPYGAPKITKVRLSPLVWKMQCKSLCLRKLVHVEFGPHVTLPCG